MRVEIIERQPPGDRLLCEAALVFDDTTPLAGLRLLGFTVWWETGNEVFVSFPRWPVGVGSARRYFEYLHGDDDARRRFKGFILDAVNAWWSATRDARRFVLAPDTVPSEAPAAPTRRRRR